MLRSALYCSEEEEMKKFLLAGTNLFQHAENKMQREGDVARARTDFEIHRFNNLDYLLHNRYSWMNEFLTENSVIVEVGAGAGFSSFYLNHPYTMTDITANDWIDKVMDATNMDYPYESIDVVIASHNIHHLVHPSRFFRECERVLKNDGLILIQELNTSLFMRTLLRVMKHEGWSYDVDVFDDRAVANDPSDPWSANCAIPELIFEQSQKFHRKFQKLKIEKNVKNECFLFTLSGGVIAKTNVLELPKFLLRIVDLFDRFLVKLFPGIFALGRSVVIRKTQYL